jgi:hypothetical protein
MAIEIQQNKRHNPIFGIIVAVVIIGVGFWFVKNFLRPSDLFQAPQPADVLPSPISQQLAKASLNINGILTDPVFQTLSAHITWPLPTSELGRSNPFQPF